jgi:pilus assembly protein Flp/PilA
MRFLRRLIRDERGANAIEYALVASLISIAAIVAMTQLGQQIGTSYNNVNSCLKGSC